jgi:hypothetical protein
VDRLSVHHRPLHGHRTLPWRPDSDRHGLLRAARPVVALLRRCGHRGLPAELLRDLLEQHDRHLVGAHADDGLAHGLPVRLERLQARAEPAHLLVLRRRAPTAVAGALGRRQRLDGVDGVDPVAGAVVVGGEEVAPAVAEVVQAAAAVVVGEGVVVLAREEGSAARRDADDGRRGSRAGGPGGGAASAAAARSRARPPPMPSAGGRWGTAARGSTPTMTPRETPVPAGPAWPQRQRAGAGSTPLTPPRAAASAAAGRASARRRAWRARPRGPPSRRRRGTSSPRRSARTGAPPSWPPPSAFSRCRPRIMIMGSGRAPGGFGSSQFCNCSYNIINLVSF